MDATQAAYKQLITAIVGCNSIEQVKSVIKQILNIDENHLMFEDILRKLCDRAGIDYESDSALNKVIEYLEKLESKLVVRAYDAKSSIEDFAEKLVSKWNVMQSLNMAQFKRIAMDCGYVIGSQFKSTRILSNIIETNN